MFVSGGTDSKRWWGCAVRLTVRWHCGGGLWAAPAGVCCCSGPLRPCRYTGWDTAALERSCCPPRQNLSTQTGRVGGSAFIKHWCEEGIFYMMWFSTSGLWTSCIFLFTSVHVKVNKLRFCHGVFMFYVSVYRPRSGSQGRLRPAGGSLEGRPGSGSGDSPSRCVGSEATPRTRTDGSRSWKDWPEDSWWTEEVTDRTETYVPLKHQIQGLSGPNSTKF